MDTFFNFGKDILIYLEMCQYIIHVFSMVYLTLCRFHALQDMISWMNFNNMSDFMFILQQKVVPSLWKFVSLRNEQKVRHSNSMEENNNARENELFASKYLWIDIFYSQNCIILIITLIFVIYTAKYRFSFIIQIARSGWLLKIFVVFGSKFKHRWSQ